MNKLEMNNTILNIEFEEGFSYFKVIEHYRHIGVNIASGTDRKSIDALQKELDFVFPNDFQGFHLMCNGFLDRDMDNHYFSIWPFDRLTEEYEQEKKKDYDFIPICDYLINSHWYGYIRGRKGVFKDFNRKAPIAKDFKEFLKLLLINSDNLY